MRRPQEPDTTAGLIEFRRLQPPLPSTIAASRHKRSTKNKSGSWAHPQRRSVRVQKRTRFGRKTGGCAMNPSRRPNLVPPDEPYPGKTGRFSNIPRECPANVLPAHRSCPTREPGAFWPGSRNQLGCFALSAVEFQALRHGSGRNSPALTIDCLVTKLTGRRGKKMRCSKSNLEKDKLMEGFTRERAVSTQKKQLEEAKVIAQSLSAASPSTGASRSAPTKTYRCQVFGVGAVREPPVRLRANP